MKKYILAAIGIIFIAYGKVAIASEEKPIICNECVTFQDFHGVAQTLQNGNYIVVNLETRQARKFEVSSVGIGTSKTVIQQPLPAYVLEALDTYNDWKVYFDEVNNGQNPNIPSNQSNNLYLPFSLPDANGCTNAPDFPFKAACDRHDQCYNEGGGLSKCNKAFLDDMLATTEQITSNLSSSLFQKAILNHLFSSQARAYYTAVRSFGKEFYCNVNPNRPICLFDDVNDGIFNDPEGSGGTLYGGTSELYQPIGSTQFEYTVITCELWKFPDGSGGFYELMLNCE
jgi:hypothetical protein